MCDYMYDPGSLCVQVAFEEAQLCDMPLSLEKYIPKDTMFLNTPQQTQTFQNNSGMGSFQS